MVEKLDTQSRRVEKRFHKVQIFASALSPLLENPICDLVIFDKRESCYQSILVKKVDHM